MSSYDPVIYDPATGEPWPMRLDTRGASRYLEGRHGLVETPQTLTRKRSEGVGIRWKFHGQRPLVTREEIDRYVREDALKDVSPLKGRNGAAAQKARAAKAAKAAATRAATRAQRGRNKLSGTT